MSRMLSIALAAAVVATSAAPAVAQTANDTARLQTAQDRVNQALSVYRQQSSAGGYNRNGNPRGTTARSRLDTELSNLRTEVDRYQSIVRSSNGYASGNGYSNGNGYSTGNGYPNGNGYSNTTNGQYADNYQDDPNYDASRYYRDGSNYQERELSQNDRVYRGTDGRYYCKRNDGTTGLIVGAVGGGVLGNVIDGGRSRGVGTILGAIGGALAGRAVQRGNSNGTDANGNSVRCR